jgi:hypothetical protein
MNKIRDSVGTSPTTGKKSKVSTNGNTRDDRHPRNQKIPHTLIFTHHVNLLEADLYPQSVNISSTTDSAGTTTTDSNSTSAYTEEELQEFRALQANVHRIIAMHNTTSTTTSSSPTRHEKVIDADTTTTTVRFLTDQDCINSIRQWAYLSATHNHSSVLPVNKTAESTANELISYFRKETKGMFKADLCRGVALYETGGIYMDVDLGVRMNLYDVLLESSEFVTVMELRDGDHASAFFQAFIAVVPFHDVIHRYVELFLLYYRRKIRVKREGHVGVVLLKRAYDEIQREQERQIVQSQHQKQQNNVSDGAGINVSTPTTHLQQTTELWQEVLYLPQHQDTIFRHVPIPTWGEYKAVCKVVVVIPPTNPERRQRDYVVDKDNRNNSSTNTSNVPELIVPMYSRIEGSRMCKSIDIKNTYPF